MAAHVDEILDREEASARETGDGVVKWRDPGDKARVRAWCREWSPGWSRSCSSCVIPYEYEPHVRFKVPLTIPGPGGQPREILLPARWTCSPGGRGRSPLAVDDLKGTEDTSYWRKVTGQLLFYEIAVRGMTGHWPEVSGLIQPMCPEPVLRFYFTADDRREMFADHLPGGRGHLARRTCPQKRITTGAIGAPVKAACPKFAHGRGRVPLAG